MNAKEIIDFVVANHKENYEGCLNTINAELLRRQISALTSHNRKYERIDKEHPPIRLTSDESKVEGCNCRISNKGERGCC